MSNCKSIITPEDCHPDGAAQVPVTGEPEIPPAADPGTAGPMVPEAPPVKHVQSWDLPSFDLSAAGDAATTATVCGVVVVAMLVMIVAVAARRPLAPHRLRNFTIGSLLLPVASVVAGGSWSTPASLLWSGAARVADGDLTGLRSMVVLGAPVAALTATYWWAQFVHKTNTVGLKDLGRTERVQAALAQRQLAGAARAAKSGAPFTTNDGIVLGPCADRRSSRPLGLWSELTTRHEPWMVVPHKEARRQMAAIGSTGSGKTELIKRYAVGMLEYEWNAWQRWIDVPGMRGKHPRPLLVVVSCKGGQDDKVLGRELRDIAQRKGIDADRIAEVPHGARLDVWNMAARDQRAVLGDMLNAGQASTSEGQHFDELRRRVVALVVDAPAGPPRSSSEFLERLDAAKLLDLWGNAPDVKRMVAALQAEKVPQIDDMLIKATNLFDSLQDENGRMVFDGGVDFDALDVLYVTVPGLDKDAARAQVAAILRMLMQRAGRTAKDQRRSVTLIIDELSALTTSQGSIGLEEVCERGRSQGVSVLFAAQSPEGVAGDQWALNRILKSCAGGVLIGYSENAGELCKHFGPIHRMLPSRHLIKGQRTGDEGQVSVGEKWLVDPNRVREFTTGQFVYAARGRAVFGHVVPVDPATLRPLPGTTATDPVVESVTADATA
ncbi:hypothetical protein [Nocardia sp. NBC_01009]|uniref:hypothetical protein n=1 Tax=Nocardia sp. NBC_01009 TaxID=2975996 RepID=UPI00386D2CDB|nr:type IV secretory system conjugative DNA transfer family protein [Nocardia sp. NBC_01009]